MGIQYLCLSVCIRRFVIGSDVIFMYTGMALNGRDVISLTTDKLSADAVSESVTCASCGAISLFIGMSVFYINLTFAFVYNSLKGMHTQFFISI